MVESRRLRLVILLVLIGFSIEAQERIEIKLESSVSVANDDVMPMWLHANEWGKYNTDSDLYGMLYARGTYQVLNNEIFSLKSGAGFVVNTDFRTSFLHEAFLNGHFWKVDFSVGKEADSWVAYNDRLTSGSFLMSQNTRPIPKITMGLKEYNELGFLPDWFQIKGGITQGILNDDRGDHVRSADNLLLHEKWAYGRFGNKAVKPYFGIVHSALFGGARPDGTKIPIDFWPTFFAKGSSKLGGGEETNAAGAHMGLWDFGVYLENEKYDLQFYYQKPFADGSGLNFWYGKNRDYIIGVLVYPKDISWLKGVSFELIKTDVQSGYGIPDPLYPVDYDGHKAGSIIWRSDVEDNLDDFMYQVFGQERTGWTWKEAIRVIENETNEGNQFGGRDSYMTNGTYFKGWTYHGASMGAPLYHTIEKVQKYYGGELNNHNFFINNRVTGFHLGIEGRVSKEIDFRLKTTYSVNYGSYDEEFERRYSWNRTENYFYEGGKKQMYTMIEASWKIPYVKGLRLNGTFAYDFGQLYHSFGGRIGVVYCPFY